MSPCRRRPAVFVHHGTPPVTPTFLFDASGVPDPYAAYSLRRLRTAYIGPAIRVQRASDNLQANIGFTSTGALDTAALSAHCAGAVGYVTTWYDQGPNALHLTQMTLVNMPRIFTGVTTELKNTKPSVRFMDQRRGMATAAFNTYTGNAMTAFAVAALPNGATDFSPRFVSLISAAGSDVDGGGAYLLSRAGGATFTQEWAIQRNGVVRLKYAGVYGQLSQVTAQINEPNYLLAVDGISSTAAASVGAFSFNRIGMGFTGSTTQTGTDEYVSECILMSVVPTTTQQSTVQASQKSFYATPTGTPPIDPPPPGGGTGNPNYVGTLVERHNFEAGIYDKSKFFMITGGVATQSGQSWNSRGGAYNLVQWPDENDQDCVLIGQRKNPAAVNGKEGGYLGWSGVARRGGIWRWSQQYPAGDDTGWGRVPLIWPTKRLLPGETGQPREHWPQDGELDTLEVFSGQAFKTSSGDHFMHNMDRATRAHIQYNMGNVRADLTQRHTHAIAWYPGSDDAGTGAFIRIYFNDVLRFEIRAGQMIGSRDARDFIPYGTNAIPMNQRFQTEAYGRTAAQSTDGPRWWKLYFVEFWNLP